MNKVNCPKFEDCSAPLCPLDETSIKNGIFYPDEEICQRRDFQTLDWIQKQKAIVRARAPNDKFFNIPMLEAITRVQKGITGIDPNQALDKAKQAERNWIIARQKSPKLQSHELKKERNSIAKKRGNLVGVTNTSNREKEVKNDV